MWSKRLLDAPIQTDMMSFLILNAQQSDCVARSSNKIRDHLKPHPINERILPQREDFHRQKDSWDTR